MNKFVVKAWRDYHGVPTLFLVVDEDDCEIARFPSEGEAVSKAAALEEESRFLQELATAARDAGIADIFTGYKDFLEDLPPRQRKRVLAEAQDILADRELSDLRLTHVCPDCGGHADIVGGHNSIDYVRCGACGYYGAQFEEDGVVYDIRVATEGGLRRRDEAAYEKRIAEIRAQQPPASR